MKKRIVSLLLVLVLVCSLLPTTAFAAWESFRGSRNNMAITGATTPVSDYAKLKWAAKIGTAPADGAMNVTYAGQPVLDGGYIFVTAGGTLYKLNAQNGSVAARTGMKGQDKFGTTPPTISGDTVYVALDGGKLAAFSKSTLSELWTATGLSGGGQNSCPVLAVDGRVYTGFWSAQTAAQNYVCLDAKTGNLIWSYESAGGFYWAGAVAIGDYIFVGTDDGADDNNGSSTGTSRILSFRKDETGKKPVPQTFELTGLGDVRSSLAYVEASGRIYFTTKGGYLCSAKVDEAAGTLSDLKTCKLKLGSTSTPVYYNGYVYAGEGAGPGAAGYFAIVKEDSATGNLRVAQELSMPGSTQGSPLLSTAYEKDGYLWLYDCANYEPGGLTGIRVSANDPGSTTQRDVFAIFDAAGYEQYCTASPICADDGTIYYSNNSGYLFAVEKTQAPVPVFTKQPQSAAYNPGETAAPLTVTATAADGAQISYQWESSSDESTWTAIPDATGSSYIPPIPASIDSEQVSYYRCVATTTLNGNTAQMASSAAAITVKKLSGDTTLRYIVTNSNSEPPVGTPTEVTPDESPVVLSGAALKESGIDRPRIWFQPPENGTLRVELVSHADKATYSKRPAGNLYTDRVYFGDGIKAGTNIIRVTVTAEDGKTSATYLFALTPDGNYDGVRNVYVTVSDRGSVVVAQKRIAAEDLDGDGKVTAGDVLRAVHAKYCPDGANGFATASGSYGVEVTRFWGVETGNVGYWNNGEMCMGLTEEVRDGDYFDAMSYIKIYPDTEGYAKFGAFSYEAAANTGLSVSVLAVTEYDASFDPIFGGCAGAGITAYRAADGAVGTPLDQTAYTVAENGNGLYTVTFSQAGAYYLVAATEGGTITPAVCSVSVSEAGQPSDITVTFSLLGDEKHGADGEVHTLKGGGLTTWIDKQSVTVPAGSKVLDVIEKAFVEQVDPSYRWTGEPNYIRAVTRTVRGGESLTLSEFDNGANSGWMYTINDEYSDRAVNEQQVAGGDAIVLHYTDDHTLEAGITYTPQTVMALIERIGTVTRTSGPAIDAARSAYDSLTEEEKTQVTNYDTLLQAEEAFRALTPDTDWEKAYRKTGEKLLDQVLRGEWTTGSVGGEWLMLGLARAGQLYGGDVEDYVRALETFVTDNINASGQIKRSGTPQATENARVALAATALGYDARAFAGKDLLAAFKNTAWVIERGNASSAFALLAMNAKSAYLAADAALQSAAETLVKSLVENQKADGSWSSTKTGSGDLDTTAMAVTALAAYREDNAQAAEAIELALSFLSGQQRASGAIGTTAETTAQTVVALSTLGIDAATDVRFIRDGKSALDGLLQFYLEDGGFYHAARDDSYNQMASEQAYYALVAYARLKSESAYGLYQMDDAKKLDDAALDEVLADIEKLEVADAGRETYLAIRKIEQKIRYLKDDGDIQQAKAALAVKQEEFDALLNEAARKARLETLPKLYDVVVEAAKKEDEKLLTDEVYEALRKVMAQAETDISAASHTDEIGQILKQARLDMENALHRLRVSFRLIGDFVHDELEGEEHTAYVTWIPTKTYSLGGGATVKDLLLQALEDAELEETGADNGYVSAILAPEALGGYWLSEMDNGANSGWMYTVNGEHPDQALDDFELEDGDKVVWHYVDDYTTEADQATWLKAADISPEEYAKEQLEKIVRVVGRGEITPALRLSDIGQDVTFHFEPDQNQQLLDVTVDGKSIGTPESYTYENLSLDSRIKATFTGTMRFIDVRRTDWFYGDVSYVVQNGLFHGTSEDTFSPNAPMTRGMLVTVLYRLAGSPQSQTKDSFADVASEKYYAAAISWAAENEIVGGVAEDSFAPDASVTREQLAAIFYRFAKSKNYAVGKTADLTAFSDETQISAYAREALSWANAEGLVSGRSGTELAPQGQATRAEVAAILHRFAENVAK